MNIVAICAIALITSILTLTIKKYNSDISIIVAILGCVFILLQIISAIGGVIDQMKALLNSANINTTYLYILLKSIGICFLTEFSIDTCKDAGQNALANNVSIAGKLMVLITALPLFTDILNFAITLMGS